MHIPLHDEFDPNSMDSESMIDREIAPLDWSEFDRIVAEMEDLAEAMRHDNRAFRKAQALEDPDNV